MAITWFGWPLLKTFLSAWSRFKSENQNRLLKHKSRWATKGSISASVWSVDNHIGTRVVWDWFKSILKCFLPCPYCCHLHIILTQPKMSLCKGPTQTTPRVSDSDQPRKTTYITAMQVHAFPCLLWLRSRDEFDYKKFWTLIFEIKSPPPLDDVIEFISFLRDDKDLAFCRNFNAISNCFDSLSKLTHKAYSSHMLRGIWTFSAIMSMYGLTIAPKTNELHIPNRPDFSEAWVENG